MADEPKQYVPLTPPRNEQEQRAQELLDQLNAKLREQAADRAVGRPPTRYTGSFPDDGIRWDLTRPGPLQRPGRKVPSRAPGNAPGS
jgi:hypothetical protein